MDNKELTWQEFAALFTSLRIGGYAVIDEDRAINEINQPECTPSEDEKKNDYQTRHCEGA